MDYLRRELATIKEARALRDQLDKLNQPRIKEFGVPQGTATACSLATIAVEPLTVDRDDVVMYADDGLTFSEEAWDYLTHPTLKRKGVYKEESKSRILKSGGL